MTTPNDKKSNGRVVKSRVALSTRQKMQILEQYDEKCLKMSKSTIAKELKIPTSTLCHIVSMRRQIEEQWNCGVFERKKFKSGKYVDLERALLQWLVDSRDRKRPVTGNLLADKAVKLAKSLNAESEFTASTGWISRFKARHGISFAKTTKQVEIARPMLLLNDLKHSEVPSTSQPRQNVYTPENLFREEDTDSPCSNEITEPKQDIPDEDIGATAIKEEVLDDNSMISIKDEWLEVEEWSPIPTKEEALEALAVVRRYLFAQTSSNSISLQLNSVEEFIVNSAREHLL